MERGNPSAREIHDYRDFLVTVADLDALDKSGMAPKPEPRSESTSPEIPVTERRTEVARESVPPLERPEEVSRDTTAPAEVAATSPAPEPSWQRGPMTRDVLERVRGEIDQMDQPTRERLRTRLAEEVTRHESEGKRIADWCLEHGGGFTIQ